MAKQPKENQQSPLPSKISKERLGEFKTARKFPLTHIRKTKHMPNIFVLNVDKFSFVICIKVQTIDNSEIIKKYYALSHSRQTLYLSGIFNRKPDSNNIGNAV